MQRLSNVKTRYGRCDQQNELTNYRSALHVLFSHYLTSHKKYVNWYASISTCADSTFVFRGRGVPVVSDFKKIMKIINNSLIKIQNYKVWGSESNCMQYIMVFACK